MRRLSIVLGVAAVLLAAAPAWTACCYFSAKNADILQPAQKVFLTWDPATKSETFTVQPKFEGNALDFGMVIPTPSQPKLHEMPRDFFKEMAVYGILKNRVQVKSNLLTRPNDAAPVGKGFGKMGGAKGKGAAPAAPKSPPPVVVLESGIVG